MSLSALSRLNSRYKEEDKTEHLRHWSEDCRRLMDKPDDLIEVNHFEAPTDKVLKDQT